MGRLNLGRVLAFSNWGIWSGEETVMSKVRFLRYSTASKGPHIESRAIFNLRGFSEMICLCPDWKTWEVGLQDLIFSYVWSLK